MLLGKARLIEPLKKAARSSPADETLLAAQRTSQTTLRFAGGRIHQNLHEEDLTLWVKVACLPAGQLVGGGRVGVSATSSLKQESLRRAIDSAVTIARLSGRQTAPAFSTRPPKEPTPAVATYFPETVHRPLEETVSQIRSMWDRSHRAGMELAGSFVAGESELAVVGSGGLAQYQPFTAGGIRLVATRNGSSGFAAQAVREIGRMDAESLLKRAWDFCRLNRNPKEIRMGRYNVLLEPEAVAELVEWLGAIGFGAKQMADRTSFMTGRIGDQILDPKISIADDGSDPRGLAVPFDMEGIPKQRVDLIRRGRAAGVVYDSHHARLYHRHSTGHALAYDEIEGPLAGHLVVAPGKTPRKELLKKLDRGLWITRFHYVNGLLNTQQALMTGLTRDGTFLVKDGKVAGAVKNLRFTESILEAFSRVIGVSDDPQLVADPAQGFSSVVTPALLLRGFTFTGQTK